MKQKLMALVDQKVSVDDNESENQMPVTSEQYKSQLADDP